MSNLSVLEVAIDLGIPKRTVQHYCKEGFLPSLVAIHRGKPRYEVENSKYLEWKNKHFRGVKKGSYSKYTQVDRELTRDALETLALEWLDWCKTGKLTGKPLAKRTIEIYEHYFKLYLDGLGKYPQKPLVSVDNLRNVISSYPVESYSTKRNIYDAVMSFTKFLVETEKTTKEQRERFKSLKPKRFLPARKTSLTEKQLREFINNIDDNCGCSDYDRLTTKAIIVFLANTGLRVSECGNLKLEDIDLENRKVFVKLGKGNKNRIVGMNQETYEILLRYLKERLRFQSEYFFVNRLGAPFNKQSLSKKINRLAKKVGLDITCHGLRRSFVTINAGKGKPLNHLRIACGHSDLSTTQSYCMTTVDEVVEAMKDW